uniref:Uncharacterized protein n=1 Tax=Arundo donax TaxID=35708 RepID=A0A0A9FNQ1_ARUDO
MLFSHNTTYNQHAERRTKQIIYVRPRRTLHHLKLP